MHSIDLELYAYGLDYRPEPTHTQTSLDDSRLLAWCSSPSTRTSTRMRGFADTFFPPALPPADLAPILTVRLHFGRMDDVLCNITTREAQLDAPTFDGAIPRPVGSTASTSSIRHGPLTADGLCIPSSTKGSTPVAVVYSCSGDGRNAGGGGSLLSGMLGASCGAGPGGLLGQHGDPSGAGLHRAMLRDPLDVHGGPCMLSAHGASAATLREMTENGLIAGACLPALPAPQSYDRQWAGLCWPGASCSKLRSVEPATAANGVTRVDNLQFNIPAASSNNIPHWGSGSEVAAIDSLNAFHGEPSHAHEPGGDSTSSDMPLAHARIASEADHDPTTTTTSSVTGTLELDYERQLHAAGVMKNPSHDRRPCIE